MPRIRRKADDYALKDYKCEIKAQSARLGYDTQESLARAVGLSRPTISEYLKDPLLYLGTLRRLVQTLKLDPIIALKVIGYSNNDIKKLRKGCDTMSEFDRENEEVFSMVHSNPYRTGVKRMVGYIVPAEQAERLAVLEAAESKGGRSGMVWLCMVVLVTTVAFILRFA